MNYTDIQLSKYFLNNLGDSDICTSSLAHMYTSCDCKVVRSIIITLQDPHTLM